MVANSTILPPWTLLQCLQKKGKWFLYVQIFLFVILFLNAPIILVLVRKLRRLSSGNTIILHMSVADFFLSLAAICNNFVLLAGSPLRVSNFFCKLTVFVARLTCMSSVYCITIMAATRCYSVVKPLQYRAKVRPSRINKICFGAWCLSLVMAVIPLIGWGEYEVAQETCYCWLDAHKYPYNWLVYCIISHVFPLATNSVFISTTVSKIRKQKNKMKAIRMRHNARRTAALFNKTELEPNVLSGFCHVISLKELKETSAEVNVEIHQAYSSESEHNPRIPRTQSREEMQDQEICTNMNSEAKHN